MTDWKLLALRVPTGRLQAFRDLCNSLHVSQTGVINDFIEQWVAASCPNALVIPSKIGRPLLDLRRALFADAANGDCLGAIVIEDDKPDEIPLTAWERRLSESQPGVAVRTAGR